MKHFRNSCLLISLALATMASFAQSVPPAYILRLAEADDKPSDNLAARTLEAALNALHKSNRVDVLFDPKTNAAATHVLEAGNSYSVVKDEFQVKKYIDSTQTIIMEYAYTIQGRVEMLSSEVESGMVAGRTALVCNGKASKEFKVGYTKVGWAKGMDTSDKKLKESVVAKARNILAGQLPPLVKAGQDGMVKNMGGVARNAHYKLFPYRVQVVEATEVKGDKVKTIKIAAGNSHDLIIGDELMVYTVREITSGDKAYEHFDLLGRAAVEKINDKDGLYGVEKGKKEILAALNAGKTVYGSPEKPYTISKSGAGLNIAVAAFVTPNQFTSKNREVTYRRLRFNLMSKQGYNLLERKNLSALNTEKELQKQENFIDKAVVDQYKSIGADLLLEVVCSEIISKINRDFDTNKAGSAKVEIDYLMRLVSVETGEVLGEQKIPYSKFYKHNVNEEDPVLARYNAGQNMGELFFVEEALKGFNINPSDFLDEMLPPRVIISEVTEEKKDRAEEVLLVGDFNFKAQDKWNVVRKRNIVVDGKELIRFEPIGIVSLRDNQGEGVANAKVKDGGEQILAAMKAGEMLYIMDKPNWAERWSSSYLYKHGY